MKNFIRFSIFGNYDSFSTNNIEKYVDLIKFFSLIGYKPMTANELKLLPNGQAQIYVMPTFVNGRDLVVEITTNRINFSLTTMDLKKNVFELFNTEVMDLIANFAFKFEIVSNRLAINYNKESPIQESPNRKADDIIKLDIEEKKEIESLIRQCFRVKINAEECNVVFERNNNSLQKITRYTYDVNTIIENASLRFNNKNYIEMLESMEKIILSNEGNP